MEKFIDSIKMGKGNAVLLDKLWEKATVVANLSKVYPQCWNWMGRPVSKGGRGTRIPSDRLEAGDYMLANSVLDEIVHAIRYDVARLKDYLGKEEVIWQYAKGVPARVSRKFPRNPETVQAAEWLMNTWNQSWSAYLKGEIDAVQTTGETLADTQRKAMHQIILHGGRIYMVDGESFIHEGVRTHFMDGADEVEQSSIAVEIARLSYMVRYPKDALLWQDFMAKAYARAWWQSGVTSRYVPVKLDRKHGDLRTVAMRTLMEESMVRSTLRKEGKSLLAPYGSTMKVFVVAGVVMRLSDKSVVGIAMEDIVDGEYTMNDSLIEVKPSE
jgi:hypothetical protein